MELGKFLVLTGLVAAPLFAALTLWYSGVAVAHARDAQKCGRWRAMAGVWGVMSVAFIMSTVCAIYAGRVNYGWLINHTPNGPKSLIGYLVITYLLVWLAAFVAGKLLIKRRQANTQHAVQVGEPEAKVRASEPDTDTKPAQLVEQGPPVREYGQPAMTEVKP